MDAFKYLSAGIPDWLQRLDDISGQIEQRQLELAKAAEAQQQRPSKSRSVKSGKSSTETARPADVSSVKSQTPPPAPGEPSPANTPDNATDNATDTAAESTQATKQPHQKILLQQPPSPPQTQTSRSRAAAPTKVQKNLRKRSRTDSLRSIGEVAAPKYRSKVMVTIYYDSYVQNFFGDLVKFVSASRNLLRKAKMAAKVAHIKRMAEMEVPNNDEEEDGGSTGELLADPKLLPARPQPTRNTPLLVADSKTQDGPLRPDTAEEEEGEDRDGTEHRTPLMKLVARTTMRAYGLGPGDTSVLRPTFARAAARGAYAGGGLSMLASNVSDAFDSIDKKLDALQSLCEHAAHQFLRNGDCNEEVENLKVGLIETAQLAAKEVERRLKEDPESAKTPEPLKTRSYRLQSMRRESGSFNNKETRDPVSSPASILVASPLLPASPLPPLSPTLPPPPTQILEASAPKANGTNGVLIPAEPMLEADEAAHGFMANPVPTPARRVLNSVH